MNSLKFDGTPNLVGMVFTKLHGKTTCTRTRQIQTYIHENWTGSGQKSYQQKAGTNLQLNDQCITTIPISNLIQRSFAWLF